MPIVENAGERTAKRDVGDDTADPAVTSLPPGFCPPFEWAITARAGAGYRRLAGNE